MRKRANPEQLSRWKIEPRHSRWVADPFRNEVGEVKIAQNDYDAKDRANQYVATDERIAEASG
jgi:hypothetical protein